MKNQTTASSPVEQELFDAVEEALKCTNEMLKAFRSLDRQARLRSLHRLSIRMNIGMRGWISVMLIIVCIVGMALPIVASIIHSQGLSGEDDRVGDLQRGFPVSWKDQTAIPQTVIGNAGWENNSETIAAFNKTYQANSSGRYTGPVVTVPRDITVMVVARQDRGPGVSRILIDERTGPTMSCALQAGGILRRIGIEGSRQLVVYLPPTAHPGIGEKWCVSGDMFYMRRG